MAVGKFMMSNIAMLMSHRVSAKEVAKIIDKLDIKPSDNLEIIPHDEVKIAAAQVQIKKYQSLGDYIIDMNCYVSDAVNKRSHLVCFPAFSGLLPLGFISQFSNMLPELQMRGNDIPSHERIAECLSYFSDIVFEAFYNTMSILAARHRVYIMAGSTLYLDKKEPKHRAFLFNGNGELVGAQDKLLPNQLESALKIEAASELLAFNTPFGSVSMLIGSDVERFEPARVAKSLGANIILNPTVIRGSYTPMDAAGGLNLRVQENSLYGVQSTMVGDTGIGAVLETPCAVFGPNELLRTRMKNGLIEQSSGRNEPDVLCIKLDLDVIENIRNSYLHDKNPDLLNRYIDRLY